MTDFTPLNRAVKKQQNMKEARETGDNLLIKAGGKHYLPYHCMSGDNSTRLRPTNYKYYFKEEKRPAAHICHCHELYPHPAWCRHTKDSYMKGRMVKTKKKIILYLKKKKVSRPFLIKLCCCF